MVLVTRQEMLDDGGLFTTGTVINEDFVDAIYDEIDDQCHSLNNLTIKPKAITDEVVAARGSMASLDERLDVSLNADGTLAASFVNVSGGLRVGFVGTTSADRIDLGDADFYLDFAAGGAGIPGIFFDTDASIVFNRTIDDMIFAINGATRMTLDEDGLVVTTRAGVGAGTVALPSVAVSVGSSTLRDLGLYRPATDSLGFVVKGFEAARIQEDGIFSPFKGANVASAASPKPSGNVFHLTGVTNVTSLNSTGIRAGTVITIIFDDVLTFTDGNNLVLAGNFVTTANDTITLVYDGTNWYEIARSVN